MAVEGSRLRRDRPSELQDEADDRPLEWLCAKKLPCKGHDTTPPLKKEAAFVVDESPGFRDSDVERTPTKGPAQADPATPDQPELPEPEDEPLVVMLKEGQLSEMQSHMDNMTCVSSSWKLTTTRFTKSLLEEIMKIQETLKSILHELHIFTRTDTAVVAYNLFRADFDSMLAEFHELQTRIGASNEPTSLRRRVSSPPILYLQ